MYYLHVVKSEGT